METDDYTSESEPAQPPWSPLSTRMWCNKAAATQWKARTCSLALSAWREHISLLAACRIAKQSCTDAAAALSSIGFSAARERTYPYLM